MTSFVFTYVYPWGHCGIAYEAARPSASTEAACMSCPHASRTQYLRITIKDFCNEKKLLVFYNFLPSEAVQRGWKLEAIARVFKGLPDHSIHMSAGLFAWIQVKNAMFFGAFYALQYFDIIKLNYELKKKIMENLCLDFYIFGHFSLFHFRRTAYRPDWLLRAP